MATTTYGSPYVSGSDLVAGWPAASLTVADAIDAAGYYVGRGINTQTASYTGVLTDAGKTVTMSNAGATTVTIPPNSSVAYPTGTRINILNLGAGACTPTAGAGVTISGTISALATNQGAAVVKTATNTWSYLPFTSGTPTLTSADVSSTTGSPTITTSGIYTIYKFTGSGSIVLSRAGLADMCLVGGGGAAGDEYSGGGGGGSVVAITNGFLPSGTNTVTVASGGAGVGSWKAGGIGATSTVGQYIAIGGGGGAARVGAGFYPTDASSGACGGGGSNGTTTSIQGAVALPGLGYAGGTGFNSGGNSAGGGGGGFSAVGGNAAINAGGNGGAGTANSLTGSSVTYGGGGGGGVESGTAGTGGAGGGANGSVGNPSGFINGTANTGGGGGGTGNASTQGGNGGSGVLVIRVVT